MYKGPVEAEEENQAALQDGRGGPAATADCALRALFGL